MRKTIWMSGLTALAIATPAFAQSESLSSPDTPEAYPENSGLDDIVEAADVTASAAPAVTGDPILDRFNQLEARVRQLEARNAQLEAAAAETQTRVENVEVRAAKGVQPGVAPTFSDTSGKFTFKPRGTIQVDYAAYHERGGGYDYNSGTDIRRGRFGFDGTFLTKFKYRIEAEFVKGTVNLLDAYVQYIVSPKWTVTVGQHKAPYGLEANTSDAFNSFIERGMASNALGAVGAERRVGISVGYSGDHLHANLGVFGTGEAVQRNALTPDEGYGFNGRVVWEPINDTAKLVHLGASAFHAANFGGNALTVGDRPNSRVDGGLLVSAPISAMPNGAKSANFFGGEGAVVFGPFSVQGEYGNLTINRLGSAGAVNFDGFYVFGSWFVTGESRTFKGGTVDRVKPFADFSPADGDWGALELLVRYDQLDLTDPDLSPLSRKATSWTGGLNWYLNPNLKLVFNYIRFKGENSPLFILPDPASGAGPRTAKGDIFATRLQVDF